jgi:6-phosphogluconolactonase
MKCPAKLCKAAFAASFVLLAMMGIVGPAYGAPKPNFVYVLNAGILIGSPNNQQSTVSGYSMDATTGALTPVPGSPFVAGMAATSIVVDPSNKFVYVTNGRSNNISAYTVDGTTGALSGVSGSPFATPAFPESVVVNPSGKFLYVASLGLVSTGTNGSVSAYTIDGTSGALTPVAGSPFMTGFETGVVTIDPSGKFLYGLNDGNLPNSISGYTIDSNTGALTSMTGSPFPAGVGPSAAVVDRAGKFLYVTNIGAAPHNIGSVSAYTINSGTGVLTPIAGSPYAAGTSGTSVAVDPSDKFAFVAGQGPNALATFTINGNTGALQPIGNLQFGPGSAPTVAADPAGEFAYVTTQCPYTPSCPGSDGAVSAYSLNTTTGALTSVPGSPFAAGANPAALAITHVSSVHFKRFDARSWIDEDRQTSFRVEGSFTLGAGSSGIDPATESVELQLGSFSVTVPAGSFTEHHKREYRYEGRINGTDLHFTIEHLRGDDYSFDVDGRATIANFFKNPVTVVLTIGEDTGTISVKADIDK